MGVKLRILAISALGFLVACLAACEPTRSLSPIAPTLPSAEPAPSPGRLQTFRRTIIGTVRQANGDPIEGVEIDGWLRFPESERVAVTGKDGTFRIEQTLYESLSFRKTGYELRGWHLPQRLISEPALSLAETLQPYLRMAAGERLSSVLTPDDVAYPDDISHPWDNFACAPCQLIDVSGADEGATLKLSWSGSMPLTLWAGTNGYWGYDVRAVPRPGESEIVSSTEYAVTLIVVGLEQGSVVHRRLTEATAFTLTVETF